MIIANNILTYKMIRNSFFERAIEPEFSNIYFSSLIPSQYNFKFIKEVYSGFIMFIVNELNILGKRCLNGNYEIKSFCNNGAYNLQIKDLSKFRYINIFNYRKPDSLHIAVSYYDSRGINNTLKYNNSDINMDIESISTILSGVISEAYNKRWCI